MRASGILMGLIAAGALSAGAAFAQFDEARLDGEFSTQHEGQTAPGDNEACFSFDDDSDVEVEGEVRQVLGDGCTAVIRYDTNSFNSAAGLALKGGKTAGTAKLTQSIFTEVEVELLDTDEGGAGECLLEFDAGARPERCSVKASLKGTQVPDTEEDDDNDTVESNKIVVKCELGADLSALDTDDAEGVQPPTLDQAEAVIAAFADRSDVKLGSNGKLDIKHDGVPDLVTPACD